MAAPFLNLSPMQEDPRHKAIADQIAKLQTARVQVVGKKNELEMTAQSEITEEDRSAKHVEAALTFAQTGVVAAAVKPSSHNEQHLELRAQEQALRRTIEARTADLWRLESQLNAEATASLKALHDALCTRYADALRGLDALAGEEADLFHAAHRLGYTPMPARYVQWDLLGRIDDNSSHIATRLRDFRGC